MANHTNFAQVSSNPKHKVADREIRSLCASLPGAYDDHHTRSQQQQQQLQHQQEQNQTVKKRADHQNSDEIFGDDDKQYDSSSPGCPFKIQVIDDTALIQCVLPRVSKPENHVKNNVSNGCKQEYRKKTKMEAPSRKNSEEAKKDSDSTVITATKGGGKRMYSREELEAFRCVNVDEQKKMWCEVYNGFSLGVAKEYDDLHYATHQAPRVPVNFDPQRRVFKTYNASPLPGLLATRGRGQGLYVRC